MTTGSSDLPGPADDGTSGASRGVRRAVLVLVAVAAALVVLGLVAVLNGGNGAQDPLDSDAPGLSDVTFRVAGCSWEPERGGLVVHVTVGTADAGRFSVDVSAVTAEGADNQDISSPHVVRVTVPFYGGQAQKEFDVVVPLTEAEHEQGYRRCRWDLGGA